jgi:4,4'-diaponeurosporenoate glycosyltransferase
MAGLDLVIDLARLAAGGWLLARIPAPAPAPAPSAPAAVSVVVPARNEEHNLPSLLASLPPGHQVVVVDDHSTDATADVATATGATVIAAPPLPEGWTGKTWACHTGAARAEHDVLVFLDADVTLRSGGLERILAELHHCGGLVSVQPYHHVRRPYERLSAFFNVVAMMGTGAFTPLRPSRAIGAFGPVMATSSRDYRAAGGHEAVAGEVVEDVALAARYRAAGLPVTLFGGRGVAAFRMYPGGLASLIEGWTKNFASGAGSTRPLVLLAVVAWISLCLTAIAGPLWLYGLVALQVWWMLRRIGSFGPVVAALYPVALLFFMAVFAWSAFRAARGQVSWRGRKIERRK